MIKKSFLGVAVLLGVFLYLLPAFGEGEEVFEPLTTAFSSYQRPIAQFNHDQHKQFTEEENCSACHHVYENGKLLEGENSEDQRCSECHSVDAEEGTDLMTAYHLQCKNCHEDKGGPVTCGECHQK